MLIVNLLICLCIISSIMFDLSDFGEKDSEMFSTTVYDTDMNSLLPESYYHPKTQSYLKRNNETFPWRNVRRNANSRMQ